MTRRRLGEYFLLLTLLTYCSKGVLAQELPIAQRVASTTMANNVDAIIDTRPLSSCRQASLQGAKCLPIEDVLAPQRRLANWSGLLWLLGSAGLGGDEHVLIIGQQPKRRDFLAGILLLAGQKQVSVLEQPLSELLTKTDQQHSGTPRAPTRTQVFTAPMRSELIVLREELKNLPGGDTTVLDGRTEAEYYGAVIRASRGGHIPGAAHSPVTDWLSEADDSKNIYQSARPVLYAHDTFETLVYFTAVITAGITPRVYLAGWEEWSFDSTLPVDSASYPQNIISPPATAMSAATSAGTGINLRPLIAATLVLCLLAASFYSGRKSAMRNA